MKKDIKYLLKLEEKLSTISKSKREDILNKYRTIIDEEKASNKRIVDILKDLGTPEEVAAREIEIIKNSKFFTRTISLMKIKLAKEDLEHEVVEENVVKVDTKKNKKVKENKTKEEKLANREAILKEIEYAKNEKREEKLRIKEEKKALKLAKKEENLKLKEDKNKAKGKKKKSKSKKTKIKRTIKWRFNNLLDKVKVLFKKKSKVEKAIDTAKKKTSKVADKIEEKAEEVIEDATNTIAENVFVPKKTKIIRIILKTLSIILIILLLFVFLWIAVLFIASAFAILDGVKIYGITLALFGIMLLILWIILILYRYLFRKKRCTLFWIISIIVIILIIALGAAYTIRQFYKIERVKDVSEKYNMATFYEKYPLGSKKKKTYISFNCNYKTKYIVEYDNKLNNEIKVEAKYYENYYDVYAKKTTNNIYISLKKDNRDRLSSYIDDLKEYKIYDEDEMNRYVLKITMNEADKDRVVILTK